MSRSFSTVSPLAISCALFSVSVACLTLLKRQEKQKGKEDSQRADLSRRSLLRHLSQNRKWRDYTDDDELFVQNFPKVELHVHLDGSFDPEILYNYLHEEASLVCLPVETPLPWQPGTTLKVRQLVKDCKNSADYQALCTCRGYRSLEAMLNCFECFLPVVRGNLALLEKLAYDFVKRQWQQNAVYTEVRYSPQLLCESISGGEKPSVTSAQVLSAVTKGLRRGCTEFNVIVNQILSAITWRPDWAESTLNLVCAHKDDYPCATVALDVAAGEEHFDPSFKDLHEPHQAVLKRARELGIPVTIHAGEVTSRARQNIRDAIALGATRIGHGYRMSDEVKLMQHVKASNVHVEICPTSSNETGGWVREEETKDWREHPCCTMKDNGVSFSFSSDDPAVFDTSLSWQYRIAMAKMGFNRNDITKANLDGVSASFCTEGVKLKLRAIIQSYADAHPESPLRRVPSQNFTDRVKLSNKRI